MIKLPLNWDNISYRQFIEIKNIDKSENIFLQYINILSIITNTNPNDEIWSEMDIEDLKVLIKQIDWINKLPNYILLDKIDNFILKANEELTLGEYIDIDTFFSENNLDNLSKIAAIYYRNYKYDDFGNIILEKYDLIDLNKRIKLFEKQSILNLLPLISYFSEYRNYIIKSSSHIFTPILDNEIDLDEEDLDNPIIQEEIKKEKMLEQWSWEFILNKLSNNDITKYNEILNLPFIMILNNLSFRKQFNID